MPLAASGRPYCRSLPGSQRSFAYSARRASRYLQTIGFGKRVHRDIDKRCAVRPHGSANKDHGQQSQLPLPVLSAMQIGNKERTDTYDLHSLQSVNTVAPARRMATKAHSA